MDTGKVGELEDLIEDGADEGCGFLSILSDFLSCFGLTCFQKKKKRTYNCCACHRKERVQTKGARYGGVYAPREALFAVEPLFHNPIKSDIQIGGTTLALVSDVRFFGEMVAVTYNQTVWPQLIMLGSPLTLSAPPDALSDYLWSIWTLDNGRIFGIPVKEGTHSTYYYATVVLQNGAYTIKLAPGATPTSSTSNDPRLFDFKYDAKHKYDVLQSKLTSTYVAVKYNTLVLTTEANATSIKCERSSKTAIPYRFTS